MVDQSILIFIRAASFFSGFSFDAPPCFHAAEQLRILHFQLLVLLYKFIDFCLKFLVRVAGILRTLHSVGGVLDRQTLIEDHHESEFVVVGALGLVFLVEGGDELDSLLGDFSASGQHPLKDLGNSDEP
jgi:hypothetical protein